MNREEILTRIAEETATCTKCDLHFSRKNSVPGSGPANAEIMFIGEGPGFHENEQGQPFVGAAGRFLDELLNNIGLSREQVFITNVVKCRPPGNRDPQPGELEACDSYLQRQIQTINPKVIVTLGRFSMHKFLPNAKISQAHGQAVRVKGRLVVPFYHPAAALHQPSLRPTVEADFARLPEWIDKAGDIPEYVEKVEPDQDEDKPEQLSLF
ncbi:MAG: uracil-DNA glycosylase [Anaerolineales bacterium]|nr:uracil-DNA glycosylase [Anaerolineales bacterium]